MVNEWETVNLDEVADEITVGYVGSMASEYIENGIPFLRSQNVEPLRINDADLKFISPDFHRRIAKSRLSPGDVVIVRTGKPGACSVVPDWLPDANCSDLVIVRCGDRIDNRFLAYYVNTAATHHVSSHLVGAVQQHFNVGAARTLRIKLPSIDEQRAIVHILGTLDDKIELNRRMNQTLEAVARALFQSWFVDFDPVRAKQQGREPAGMESATAKLFPRGFANDGGLPDNWRTRHLEEVALVTIGKTPPRKEPQWFSENVEDVPWVSIRDMGVSGTFISQTSERLTERAVAQFNVRRVPKDTVLLSFKLTVGRVAIADIDLVTNEAIAHFQIDPERGITTEFLYLSLLGYNFALLGSTSSIATAVNSASVRSIEILVPPSDVIQAFTSAVKPLFSRIRINQAEMKSLVEMRDAILPRLLSGEIVLGKVGA